MQNHPQQIQVIFLCGHCSIGIFFYMILTCMRMYVCMFLCMWIWTHTYQDEHQEVWRQPLESALTFFLAWGRLSWWLLHARGKTGLWNSVSSSHLALRSFRLQTHVTVPIFMYVLSIWTQVVIMDSECLIHWAHWNCLILIV